MDFTDASFGISSMLAVIMLPLVFLFGFMCLKLRRNEKFYELLPNLSDDFKTDDMYAYSLYYFRRITEPVLIVIFYPQPYLQLGSLFITNLIMVFYIYKKRPKLQKFLNKSELFAGFLLAAVYLLMFGILNTNSAYTAAAYGNVIISFISVVLFVYFLVIMKNIFNTVKSVIKEWKEKRVQSHKV